MPVKFMKVNDGKDNRESLGRIDSIYYAVDNGERSSMRVGLL
jgi:hypothetical protein